MWFERVSDASPKDLTSGLLQSVNAEGAAGIVAKESGRVCP